MSFNYKIYQAESIHYGFLVRNQVAIVTGGSSGIGLETVKLFLAQGAKVAWCGRNQDRLRQSLEEMKGLYPEGEYFTAVCDVLDNQDVKQFVHQVNERFGQIDMLINNAGQGLVSNFANTVDEQWITEVQLKYFSVLNPIKAALPFLKQSASGSITNINSLLALKPEPHMIATSAARAGLLNLTKSLAKEFAAQGIRVNSVLLGMVESGQWRRRFEQRSDQSKTWDQWIQGIANERGIPLGRLGLPQEAARALVFLASPLASYTTGSVLDVSGGFSQEI
ncbi:short chain dehydrogenase [Paenalcaligenes hominis]|uniref:Short chain dehydrogenase n=1 Tax=Paenalcaligenes hominis TaxID=643674 RepID=A0A1U9K076_9BURK|nr:SDR family oxidoreductase [Paenalcaligenes hominis]AQS51422.1 short chain dehydrogenase [Paenalcaligenes hominis]